jgi:hypothetical protein
MSILTKLKNIIPRFIAVFALLPTRFLRIGNHLFAPNSLPFLQYCYEFIILLIELIGVGEWYETLNDLFKPDIRGLTAAEIAEAQAVFGSNIDYSRILIDEKAIIACKKQGIAYVSFSLINYWGKMENAHLIHELAHVWQYQHIGARYMPRALQAQYSAEGYDYGGLTALLNDEMPQLKNYNMEQQAEIFTDFYRLRNRLKPQYGHASPTDIGVYARFVDIFLATPPNEV